MGMQSSRTAALIREGRAQLERHNVPNALHNAEWMLSGLIGCTRAELYLRGDAPVDPASVSRFEEQIQRRCLREPLQYILGSVEFMSYQFAIVPGVFIPRFETELLVERLEPHLHGRGIRERGTILDLCSGSGVIALALLMRNPGLTAVGVDSNPAAVALSERNAASLGLERRAIFEVADATARLARGGDRFDLIVSNPPYIPTAEMGRLAPEVREHEPPESLLGGADGLDFYRSAIPLLPPRLTDRGVVALEIGAGQGDAVSALLGKAGLGDVVVYNDYAGFERVVIAYASG